MCYSKSASFGSFAIGLTINTTLFLRNSGNDRWAAYMLTSVIFMQLLEGLMWSDQHSAVKRLNKMASVFAYFLLILIQPLTSILCAYYFSDMGVSFLSFFLLWWAVFFILCVTLYWPGKDEFCSLKSPLQSYLMWPWWVKLPYLQHRSYFLICILPFLFMKPFYQPIIYILWLIIIWITVTPKIIKLSNSSVYCFFIAFTGLLPLFVFPLIEKFI